MMTLSEEMVVRLKDYVDERLAEAPCDHTLRNALRWAADNGMDGPDFVDDLHDHGGYCDCEVVLNLPERLPDDAEDVDW